MQGRVWPLVGVAVFVGIGFLYMQTRRSSAPPQAPQAQAARDGSGERAANPGAAGAPEPAAPGEGAVAGHHATADDEPPPVGQPHWLVTTFAPRPGEDMLDYRDRVVPLVQALVEPQRRRVARVRAEFERDASLTEDQRRELDDAVDYAVEEIKDRVMQGVLSGELLPPNVKPSDGVAFARDILDSVDRANQRFTASLDQTQQDALAGSPFDVAEYLLLSTRWEDMLGVMD